MTPQAEAPSTDEFSSALATHARESGAPFPIRRLSLLETVRRSTSDGPVLERELVEIQRRLGTAAEQSGDVDRATEIGHKLTNLIWMALLMEEARSAERL
jgi:hypothetical protein